MAANVAFDQVEVGTEIPAQRYPVQRLTLVRYCGASGDFNTIHWNERIAKSAGLPDVIAHGMLTMAEAARLVTDWVGDPGAVEEYGVRFAKPVVVPDDDTGVEVEVSGTVTEKLDDNRAVVELSATSGGVEVLAKARAVVRLA
ncbi:MaoC family dehydratase [Saccharopolyspora sp. TS4A08]|uniref:MaoC family dehydratase n=1 Tax=Saccharopolyspora ipomoeae TaxID=3042027 RepID=A0ABT6PP87_9PSEU|nr:MaoC family dehydratase [Saccharopolyspora sp. TS4A08]MDI2029754.1 MaoC family dehydratase [Saccharopolyspora sp. TS4A08]